MKRIAARPSHRMVPFFIIIAFTALAMGCSPNFKLYKDYADPLQESTLQGSGENKIAVIHVSGFISTTPRQKLSIQGGEKPSMLQEVVSQLKRAAADPNVRAVVMMVDSPGGTIVGSDALYHELMEFKKASGKTLVALMMNVAASGGYYICLAADAIFAHPATVTGSVGTIFMVPKVHGLMDKIGVETLVIKSGALKDMGSPFRKSNENEVALLQTMIDTMNKRFLNLVKERRRLDQKAQTAVADARVLMADEAVRLGLVDAIGYTDDALSKARDLAGLHGDVRVVAYRRTHFPDDNIYNTATGEWPGRPFGAAFALPDVLTPPQAGFYYLWTPQHSAQ